MATRPAAKKLEDKAEAAGDEKKSSIPDGALRPQDHKSPKADVLSEREAETPFEYEGKTYTLIPGAFYYVQDIDVVEQLGDGNIVQPLRHMLGFEQWAKLKEHVREVNKDSQIVGLEQFRVPYESVMKALRAKN